jgi:hypothetical protein
MTAVTPRLAPDTEAAVTGLDSAMDPRGRHGLTALRDAMSSAREAVMTARAAPAGQIQLAAARRDHLAALSAYQQALTEFGLPIPPRLRDEARLLRRLLH